MDYNKMAQEVHGENKIKGFYDVEPSKDMSLLLIVSELMEMVEADRKDKHAAVLHFEIETKKDNTDRCFKWAFADYIKDSIEDEAADVIIRILDYTGWQGVDLNLVNGVDFEYDQFKELAEECWIIIRELNNCKCGENNYWLILAFNHAVNWFYKGLKIDIWKHVELKRKYNKLRPIRNGKKY